MRSLFNAGQHTHSHPVSLSLSFCYSDTDTTLTSLFDDLLKFIRLIMDVIYGSPAFYEIVTYFCFRKITISAPGLEVFIFDKQSFLDRVPKPYLFDQLFELTTLLG